MEEYYIWKYNTYEDKNHYNLTPGGDFCPMKVPEIAKKQSNSSKGRKLSKEHIEKLVKIRKNKKLKTQHRQSISKSMIKYRREHAKYKFWDIHKCHYHKGNMKIKEINKPRKCFFLKYNSKDVNIGGFIDFYTVEILYDLIYILSEE